LKEQRKKEAAYARKRRNDVEAQRVRCQRFRLKRVAKQEEVAGRKRPSECELCRCKARTVFDHCHSSGKFRGWLCDRCNRTLGSVKDDVSILLLMVEYLTRGGTHGKAKR